MSSSMYSLPLYFPVGTKVDPIGVMYSLDSYHETDQPIPDADPTKQLEKDQLDLIKLLGAFNERLDKHLSGLKKESNEKKKEGQETKKAEAKAKKPADKSSVSKEKGGKTAPPKPAPVPTTPWKMMEEKVGAEANNGISASAAPSLARFQPEKIGKVSVTVTEGDVFWMESLAKVGVKREVKFSGDVNNGVTKGSGEVQVKKGASFSLSVDSFTCSDRMTAWKILGVSLGIFSFNHQYAVQNTHSHRWLTRLDEVIEGGKKENEVSTLLSCSSQFLSRFDSLSSHAHFSLPDTLIRPLFKGNLPNNVELWAKRLDSIV